MAGDRLAYRVGEVAELTGLPRSTVMREVERKAVRCKHIGRSLLLDPGDVERVFGFAGEHERTEPGPEALEIARDLLA